MILNLMRLLVLVALSGAFVACRRPVELRGLYVSNDGTGGFFPCDQPNTVLRVNDSALTTSYRLKATQPYQLLFVRLRGVKTDSGSIYYSSHHFLVQQILEIRARRSGECPNVAPPVPLMFLRSPRSRDALTPLARLRDPVWDAGRETPERYILRLRSAAPLQSPRQRAGSEPHQPPRSV
jgi:hypothetical protein